MQVKVVRESEKLLQLPRIFRFGKSRDPIQLGTGEMASVFTDSVPEILYLGKANPALLFQLSNFQGGSRLRIAPR